MSIFANLPEINQRLGFWCSNFNDPKSRHFQTIESNPVIIKTEIVLIEPNQKLDSFNLDYFKNERNYVFNGDLSVLFADKDFYEGFIVEEKSTIFSIGERLDQNPVFVVFKGKLFISIDKNEHEYFGLIGKKSFFKHQKNRFFIEIDLHSKSYKFGNSQHKRLLISLKANFNNQKFAILFSENSKQILENLKEFGLKTNFEKDFENEFEKNSFEDILVPDFEKIPFLSKDKEENDEEEERLKVLGILDWIGFLSNLLGVEKEINFKKVLENFCEKSETDFKTAKRIDKIVIDQILSSSSIKKIFIRLKKMSEEKHFKYGILTVHCLEDNVISWGGKEHGYNFNGNNSYSFLFFPNGNYFLYLLFSQSDFNFQ